MNLLLLLVLVITVICIVHGAKVGMLKIVYGLVAWFFVFWFVSTSSPYIHDYIVENTGMGVIINEKITENLKNKYEKSEELEEGSGRNKIIELLPNQYQEDVELVVKGSIESLVSVLADYFTGLVIETISIMVAILLALIITLLGGLLINAINLFPLVNGTNKIFGAAAGVLEAMLIVWIIMYLAELFPSSAVGRFVITNCESDDLLMFIYSHNIISFFI